MSTTVWCTCHGVWISQIRRDSKINSTYQNFYVLNRVAIELVRTNILPQLIQNFQLSKFYSSILHCLHTSSIVHIICTCYYRNRDMQLSKLTMLAIIFFRRDLLHTPCTVLDYSLTVHTYTFMYSAYVRTYIRTYALYRTHLHIIERDRHRPAILAVSLAATYFTERLNLLASCMLGLKR